ncbi:MAG TPA: DUF3078 domain-containing protein [Candidatus Kryptobacter bacterium]|nr:DUF3078 domain-containing protein [Candidatus Kryptobacter bacterium]
MRSHFLLLFAPSCALGSREAFALQPAAADTVKKDTINIWVPTMVTGLNVSQIAFSNWTQGGSNALAWSVTANVGYDYKGATWGLQNHLKAAYGRTKLGS